MGKQVRLTALELAALAISQTALSKKFGRPLRFEHVNMETYGRPPDYDEWSLRVVYVSGPINHPDAEHQGKYTVQVSFAQHTPFIGKWTPTGYVFMDKVMTESEKGGFSASIAIGCYTVEELKEAAAGAPA